MRAKNTSFTTGALLLAVTLLWGCAAGPSADGGKERPLKLQDFGDDATSNTPTKTDDAQSVRYPVRVEVGWYDRADPALERALAMLQPAPLPTGESKAWSKNGFRIGTVELERTALFLGNLPAAIEGKRYTVRRADIHSALPLHSQGHDQTSVRVYNADGEPRTLRLLAGSYQLLCKTWATENPYAVRLDLLPHFYSVAQGAVQREAAQPNVDGVSFMPLRIQPTLEARRVWVLSVAPTSTAAPPGQPLSLGEAMLTRQARGRGLRGVVFIILDAEPREP